MVVVLIMTVLIMVRIIVAWRGVRGARSASGPSPPFDLRSKSGRPACLCPDRPRRPLGGGGKGEGSYHSQSRSISYPMLLVQVLGVAYLFASSNFFPNMFPNPNVCNVTPIYLRPSRAALQLFLHLARSRNIRGESPRVPIGTSEDLTRQPNTVFRVNLT